MGRGRKDWKFLHEMAGCLGQNPKVIIIQHLHSMHQVKFGYPDQNLYQPPAALLTTKTAQTAVMKVLVMKSREKGTETSQAAQTKWSFVSH